MSDNYDTRKKIHTTALQLFLKQGIKKTSLEEVSTQAGLTRITVYRYYADKKRLVEAAFFSIITILEETRREIDASTTSEIETHLDTIIRRLSLFNSGNLPARLEELRLLYPDVHQAFHQARTAAISAIFERLMENAACQARLRGGLNRAIVQAYFQVAVINVLQDPTLIQHGLSAAELFAAVKDIFLHGILKEKQ